MSVECFFCCVVTDHYSTVTLVLVSSGVKTSQKGSIQLAVVLTRTYAPINSKVRHPTPPRATPRAFQLLKIGLFNFPPLGAKKRFKCPTNSTELPLLKVKFRLQSNTLYAFQREICRNDTFKLLLKTLLKELFTTKGEILPCKSVKPCKN